MTAQDIDATASQSDALSDNELDLVSGGYASPGGATPAAVGNGSGKPLHPAPRHRHVTLVTGAVSDGVYLGSA
jgi:hypothetical protein